MKDTALNHYAGMNALKIRCRHMLVLALVLLAFSNSAAAQTFRLGDYIEAVNNDNVHRVQRLQAYMLGAAETHFLYSRMLRNWTGINILCPGQRALDAGELAALVELKIHALRRRYGEDIMGMPLTKAVQMIMEEQFKCQ